MVKTALTKSMATKYTVYFPFRKNDEETTAAVIKEVLDFVKKIFGGATVYPAQGVTRAWKEETTYVLEILVEDTAHKETRIEQLAWLILSYLDNIKSRYKDTSKDNREETVWFYEHPVILYKLDNPDLSKSTEGGSP